MLDMFTVYVKFIFIIRHLYSQLFVICQRIVIVAFRKLTYPCKKETVICDIFFNFSPVIKKITQQKLIILNGIID